MDEDLSWLKNASFKGLATAAAAAADDDDDDSREPEQDSDSEKERRKERTRREKEAARRAALFEASVAAESARAGGTRRRRALSHFDGPEASPWFVDSTGDRDLLIFGSPDPADVPLFWMPRRGRPCIGLGGAIFARRSKKDPAAIELFVPASASVSSFGVKESERYWRKRRRGEVQAPSVKVLPLPLPPAAGSTDFIPLSLPDAQQAETPRFGASLQLRTSELSERTRSDPTNVHAWLEYARLQDEILEASGDRRAFGPVQEKKMAIFQAALKHNPTSEELVLAYLSVCLAVWDAPKVMALWERIFASQGTGRAPAVSHRMLSHFLSFSLSDFASFSLTASRAARARALAALFSATGAIAQGDAEGFALGIFFEQCSIERAVGCAERAIGMAQALVEYVIFRPSGPRQPASLRTAFLAFWDSDCPRIGDDGALGFAAWLGQRESAPPLPTEPFPTALSPPPPPPPPESEVGWSISESAAEQEADRFLEDLRKSMSAAEEEEARGRPRGEESDAGSESETDPEVMAVESPPQPPLMVPRQAQELNAQRESEFREHAHSFCLVEESPHAAAVPARAASVSCDGPVDPEQFVLSGDIRDFLFDVGTPAGQLQLALRFAEFIGAQPPRWVSTSDPWHTGRLVALDDRSAANLLLPLASADILDRDPFVQNGEWELLSCRTPGPEAGPLFPPEFVRRALSRLVKAFPMDTALAEAWLIWELRNGGAAKDLAKTLLRERRDSLVLWHRYAQSELAAGHRAEALRVYETALSAIGQAPTATARRDSLVLAFACARLLVSDGKPSKALSVLCTRAMPGSKFSGTLSPTELIRVRKAFEELRRVPGAFAAAVSCQCLFEYLAAGASSRQMAATFDSALAEATAPESGVPPLERERAFEAYACLWWWHARSPDVRPPAPPRELRQVLETAVVTFPGNPLFSGMLIASEKTKKRESPDSDGRCHLDFRLGSFIAAHPTSISLAWLVAVTSVDHATAITVCERALDASRLDGEGIDAKRCAAIWIELIRRHLSKGSENEAKLAFMRAIRDVPWSKRLWLECLRNSDLLVAFSALELKDILRLAIEKEIRFKHDPSKLLAP